MERNHTAPSENNIFAMMQLVISLTPLYFFAGCYVIWFYLNELGKLSFFSTSLQNKSDLLASIISFILLSSSFSLIACLPSVLLCQLYFLLKPFSFNRVIKIRSIPLITMITSFSTLAFLSFISWLAYVPHFIKDHSFSILLILLVIISFFLTHYISVKKTKPHYFYSKDKWVQCRYFNKERIITIFMVALTGATVAFPLSLVFKFGSASSIHGVTYALILSFFISILSLIPAALFYSSLLIETTIVKKLKMGFASSIAVFIIILFLMPNLVSLLCYGALKNIGIIDETEHVYAITIPNYSPSMFPSPTWIHIQNNDSNKFYVKGTSIFSLGDSILLCPKFVIETKNKFLKYNFDNIFGNNDFSLKHLRTVAKSCVPVRKEHLAQWDAIEDSRNKLNGPEFQLKRHYLRD